MSATRLELLVWSDGQDEPASVRADQRDMAAFEAKYQMGANEGLSNRMVTFLRFLGWHALRRTGALPATSTFELWDPTVIEVELGGDPEDADPGQPEAPAATS